MNPRRAQREALGLTQNDAASRAGVSFATWRRWEEDPAKVRVSTRVACERVLNREQTLRATATEEAGRIEQAWGNHPYLTPRQASAIISVLDFWADMYIGAWLQDPAHEPLHEVAPFDELDRRTLVLVNDNKAWAAMAQERCQAVADEIESGVLPFDRPGCYFDELLMALALRDAEIRLTDLPEAFEEIPARTRPVEEADEDDDRLYDADWDAVSDAFDDAARWPEWEVPAYRDHPLLPAFLARHHPYSWFDRHAGA